LIGLPRAVRREEIARFWVDPDLVKDVERHRWQRQEKFLSVLGALPWQKPDALCPINFGALISKASDRRRAVISIKRSSALIFGSQLAASSPRKKDWNFLS